MWRSKFSVVKLMYMLTRYSVFCDIALNIYCAQLCTRTSSFFCVTNYYLVGFMKDGTVKRCKVIYITQGCEYLPVYGEVSEVNIDNRDVYRGRRICRRYAGYIWD